MDKETLAVKIKAIVTQVRSGDVDGAYKGYAALFSDPEFGKSEPANQREALKLMVMAKGMPSTPTEAMLDAHRAAVPPLTELTSAHREPGDHEMLGICHVMLGNTEAAGSIFRTGLSIEQSKNPQSDLCRSLTKRISLL
ncbi:hypothetical protein ACIGW7_23020 [Streptomyces sp. NPDC053253]|jgi:hypothetical protein|uniref:hypothetical protein n=1 Tax=Streptomyces sp. NPDC053253 TaxID=3365699 RepID=UPI0037D12811